MGAQAVTRFVSPGTYVRRTRDGMLGLAGPVSSFQRSSSWRQTSQQITWLGEWGLYGWDPGARNALRVEALDGPEAEVAAARFAALFCRRCAGTGLADPRRPRYDANRCPEPACHLGRLTGVEPSFDASYADYAAWLERERAADVAMTGETPSRASAPDNTRVATWSDAVLSFDGTCLECGQRLHAGEPAQRRKAGRWEVRCARHATDDAGV